MQGPIINSAESASQVSETGVARIVNSGITSSGVTASGVVSEFAPREVAYTLFIAGVGEFEVAKSYKAWWMDMPKVKALFEAYKAGATDMGACISATITHKQLRYFRLEHPEFGQAKEACKAVQTNRFLNTLNEHGVGDLPTVRWYLSKRHPDFRPREKVDPSGARLAQQQSQNIVINQTIDASKIAEAVAGAVRAVLDEPRGEGSGDQRSGQGVEALGSPERV